MQSCFVSNYSSRATIRPLYNLQVALVG